jgi:carbon monoxide dehydrogenase subunit G
MRLEFSGSPEIAATPEQIWERLLDPNFVASVAPGVESVESVDERHYRVVSEVGVGSVRMRFQLDVELSEVVPPKSLKLSARGRAPGSNIEVNFALEIEHVAPSHPRLKWGATSEVRGTVASVGARLLKGTAKKLTESFWDRFAERVVQASK